MGNFDLGFFKGQSGYIPVAYVELIDANTTSMTVEVEWNSTYSVQVVEESLAEGPSQPSPGESAEQTKWTEPEEADDQEVPDMTTASSAVDFATDAEYAVALYDYVGTSKEEISFKEGKIFF